MSRKAEPTIDVAIVSWNTSEAALAAARAYLATEGADVRVALVDNASRREQRELLRANCPPAVRLELGEENLGYGSAANRVLRDGNAELVCVSNADVLPERGALTELAQATLSDPRAGMVGPSFSGETARYHAHLPSAATLLGRILAGSFRTAAAATPPPGSIAEVQQPAGACFLLRREVWERLDGFDEGFFLWYEDVDLARRLYDLGYRNLVVGSALVGHTGGRAFAQLDSSTQQTIRLASIERYIRKHHRGAMPVAAPLLRASRLLRARRP